MRLDDFETPNSATPNRRTMKKIEDYQKCEAEEHHHNCRNCMYGKTIGFKLPCIECSNVVYPNEGCFYKEKEVKPWNKKR